jgi:hypothetical protein
MWRSKDQNLANSTQSLFLRGAPVWLVVPLKSRLPSSEAYVEAKWFIKFQKKVFRNKIIKSEEKGPNFQGYSVTTDMDSLSKLSKSSVLPSMGRFYH